MEAAIKSGANVDAILENLGPPLVIAATTGNYRGVKVLLDNGANIGAVDSNGYTAILTSAIFDRRDPDAPEALHEGPKDQSWGTREFYDDDPDHNTLRFTQFSLP